MDEKKSQLLFANWQQYYQDRQDDEEAVARMVERLGEIKEALSNLYELRLNEVTDRIEFRTSMEDEFQELTQRHLNSMFLTLTELNIKTSVMELRTILNSEFVKTYHPFKEYFTSLPIWDGIDHIAELANTVRTTNNDLWQVCLAKWLVALVAGATLPDVVNHTCLVFTGGQGIGKTTWALKLRPARMEKRYFYSGYINPENKDSLMLVSECLIVNLDELEALSKKQLDSLKELITKNTITYRRPYATFAETSSRSASFISSVNSKQFLRDTTGSRRWLCFEVEEIDKDHNIDMDRVFSQAYHLLQDGFRYWFDLDEIKAINENNERYQLTKVEEELLLKHFSLGEGDDADQIFTTSEIGRHIIEQERQSGLSLTNSFVQSIGRSLVRNGFVRVKQNGVWCYRVRFR